jgi:GMP synthase (glutamine-hydrolysing)
MIVVIEHEDDATLDLMAAPLERACAQLSMPIEVVRPFRGDALPGDSADLSGLIVLGGEMGALDDDVAPWLPATRRLLASAVSSGTPTLGVCLGAQLLAAATGGVVQTGSAGLELGLVQLQALPAAATDVYLAGVTQRLGEGVTDVLQYHRDAVTTLPPDAELLLTGDQYRHQAFRVGACAWGVQYHPEVSREAFDRWLLSADAEDPAAAATARAAIAAQPDRAGRPVLGHAHAAAFVTAATLVP